MMAKTREQRNAARRVRYAENKKRLDACNNFTLEVMRHAEESGYAARVEAYLRRCILEDRPAKVEDIVMTEEEASLFERNRLLWTTNSQLDGSDA
jgi:hypothetical protein